MAGSVGARLVLRILCRELSHVASEELASQAAIIKVLAAVDPGAATLVGSLELLSSDFAEHRVEGFDALVDRLFYRLSPMVLGVKGVAPTLAAAALLVGRGTSHIQLLGPFGR